MSGALPAAPSPATRAAALAALTLLVACQAAPSSPPERDAAPVTVAPATSAALPAARGARADAAGEPGDGGAPRAALGRPVEDGWIEAELGRYPERFQRWLVAAEAHRLQILVSVVEGQGEGRRLRRHGYRVDAEYVYPASAIKPLLAVASLVTLRRLAARHGVPLDAATPLAPCLGGDGDCRALGDPTNLDGGTRTVGHEIRKLLLVSDNAAFALLYDLVGQRELDELCWELGFSSVRFHHRMGESAEAGRRTAGVDLLLPGGKRIHVPARDDATAPPPTPARRLEVGRAHLDAEGRLHDRPMSFAQKNYASLVDLQDLLVALVFPSLPGAPRLGLGETDRQLLLEALTLAPAESDNPRYEAAEHPVEGQKPLLPGVRAALAPGRLRHLGKSGHAYGFQLDNAYLEDRPSGRALFVTAALHVDPDGIVNDDRYDYDGSTRPFLRHLGEALSRAVLREP